MKSHADSPLQNAGWIGNLRIHALIFALLSSFFTAMAFGGIGGKDILSADERAWLTKNQSRLVIAIETGYAPFVFLDSKEQPTGLAHDYMRLIESKLGVHFNQKKFSSLDEIFQKVLSGEVHIVNAVTSTPARAKFLSLTTPFISVPNVIIVRKDRSGQISEGALSGLKVSLVKSYAVTEHMTSHGLNLIPDIVPDDLSALLNVSFGRSDAAIIDLATASYLISEKGIANLRVDGEVSYHIQLSIATPQNEPVLHGILQKGLNAIKDAERQEIRNRWINVSVDQGLFKDRQSWLVLGGVLAVTLAIFATILSWNRTLRQQAALRKKAEEASKAAAQYSRSLIEASLDPLVTINAEGKITDVNAATEKVTGLGRADLIGSDFADYFTAPEKAREGYRQAFSQGFVTDFPLAIRHVSGKITDVLYNASLYRDDKGGILGVFAAARDITGRKQAEAKLVESESHLRAIIENEPECIKIIDAQGRLKQMNPAGLAMIEADSLGQVAERPVLDVIAPEYRAAYAALHKRVIAGESLQMQYEVLGLKGGRRWLETHAVPMRVRGKMAHLAVTRDITERKRDEEELRIAATAFDSQEGMVITDASDVVLRVNRAFTEITGYAVEEAVGRKMSFLKSDRHDGIFFAAMWKKILRDGTWQGEIWNRVSNGEVHPHWLTISAVKDDNGVVTHYVGAYTDITQRKQAEMALLTLNETLEQRVQDETAKRMEQERLLIQQSRLAAMGEMIGNIAHQWRQPINALGLLLANIKDAYEYNELDKAYLDREESKGQQMIQKMSSTIDDFRNFFKPNKEKQSFFVSDGVEEAIKMVAQNFKIDNIDIVFEKCSQPRKVMGYPNEFAQVVLNALSNAKEAIVGKQASGEIRIAIENGEAATTVAIRDNGGGIPEKILGKVFDPYFTTKEKGTGIGLYMSKMIMEHMDGEISIRNIEGGAEVLITLQRADSLLPGSNVAKVSI